VKRLQTLNLPRLAAFRRNRQNSLEEVEMKDWIEIQRPDKKTSLLIKVADINSMDFKINADFWISQEGDFLQSPPSVLPKSSFVKWVGPRLVIYYNSSETYTVIGAQAAIIYQAFSKESYIFPFDREAAIRQIRSEAGLFSRSNKSYSMY
jgi:hypothetical protein